VFKRRIQQAPQSTYCGFLTKMDQAGSLLLDIIAAAGTDNVCILHGYEGYPQNIPSDVDVIISPRGLRNVLREHFPGWRIVQCLNHESSSYYLVYASNMGGRPQFLAFDAALDCRRDGCVFYTHQEILKSKRVSINGLPTPPPEIEFAYYVTKKIGKAAITIEQGARLSKLWQIEPIRCLEQLSRFLPAHATSAVIHAADTGNWDGLNSDLPKLRNAMRHHMMLAQPFAFFGYYILELHRRLMRVLEPTGLVVACLGPDGAGKSTLMDRLEPFVGKAFRHCYRYHLRIGWIRRTPETPITAPHAQRPRSAIFSFIKLGWWALEGSVGYLLCVWPKRLRSTLVIFDRYFHDLLADPKRYRFGAPIWIAQLMSHAICLPDIFLVLDAPTSILFGRKQEVTYEECERQRTAYQTLATQLKGARLLDASADPDEVAARASTYILDFLAMRTARRTSTLFRRLAAQK
jgi:thymidylate kinase